MVDPSFDLDNHKEYLVTRCGLFGYASLFNSFTGLHIYLKLDHCLVVSHLTHTIPNR